MSNTQSQSTSGESVPPALQMEATRAARIKRGETVVVLQPPQGDPTGQEISARAGYAPPWVGCVVDVVPPPGVGVARRRQVIVDLQPRESELYPGPSEHPIRVTVDEDAAAVIGPSQIVEVATAAPDGSTRWVLALTAHHPDEEGAAVHHWPDEIGAVHVRWLDQLHANPPTVPVDITSVRPGGRSLPPVSTPAGAHPIIEPHRTAGWTLNTETAPPRVCEQCHSGHDPVVATRSGRILCTPCRRRAAAPPPKRSKSARRAARRAARHETTTAPARVGLSGAQHARAVLEVSRRTLDEAPRVVRWLVPNPAGSPWEGTRIEEQREVVAALHAEARALWDVVQAFEALDAKTAVTPGGERQ